MLVNRHPEYFLAVLREGSISRAAEKLFISQPSLSQHIARLEAELNCTLLDRSKNPLVPTAAGELYRDYLESSSQLYGKLLSDLSDSGHAGQQIVNIGMGNWRGSALYPRILPQFLQEYPEAQVRLYEYPVSELMAFIKDDKVDFAVMNTGADELPVGLIAETIVHERILLAIHRDAPAARRMGQESELTLDAKLHLLEDTRFISLTNTLTVGRHVDNFIQKNRLCFRRQIRTTDNSTALRLAAQGLGFSFLVETGLDDARNYPELTFFDLNTSDLILPLSLCYRSNSFFPRYVRRLIELIREYYADEVRRNSAIPLL